MSLLYLIALCKNFFSLLNRLLDDVKMGGGNMQGHGMVLALHMVKQLKSYRKFSELMTKKYDSLCRWLHCLKPFHEQIDVSLCVSALYHKFAMNLSGS